MRPEQRRTRRQQRRTRRQQRRTRRQQRPVARLSRLCPRLPPRLPPRALRWLRLGRGGGADSQARMLGLRSCGGGHSASPSARSYFVSTSPPGRRSNLTSGTHRRSWRCGTCPGGRSQSSRRRRGGRRGACPGRSGRRHRRQCSSFSVPPRFRRRLARRWVHKWPPRVPPTAPHMASLL